MSLELKEKAERLNKTFVGLSPSERLELAADQIDGQIVFTTSFGLEDQLIIHLMAEAHIDIVPVTLDTGRLFPETYRLWQETEEKYGLRIRAKYPDTTAVEALIADQGINGFYFSSDMRKQCCQVRKVEPLKRALDGASGWITGLRADQSATRTNLDLVSFDGERHLLKINPLYDWSRKDVADFADKHDVPVNPLHSQSYLSIGCAPCTRAVKIGEDERAGRWWWESDNARECGLHLSNDGHLVRQSNAKHSSAAPIYAKGLTQ